MPLKYVMLDLDGIETPLLFPERLKHSDVVAMIRLSVPDCRPVSAGFVMTTANGVAAYGSSLSLGVSSREQDTERLMLLLDS
jgi:hypothetical protein